MEVLRHHHSLLSSPTSLLKPLTLLSTAHCIQGLVCHCLYPACTAAFSQSFSFKVSWDLCFSGVTMTLMAKVSKLYKSQLSLCLVRGQGRWGWCLCRNSDQESWERQLESVVTVTSKPWVTHHICTGSPGICRLSWRAHLILCISFQVTSSTCLHTFEWTSCWTEVVQAQAGTQA